MATDERTQFINSHRGRRRNELSLMEQYDMQRLHISWDELYSSHRRYTDTPIKGPGVLELLRDAEKDPKLRELVQSAVRDTDTLDCAHYSYHTRNGKSADSDVEALRYYYKTGESPRETIERLTTPTTTSCNYKTATNGLQSYFAGKQERYYSSTGYGNEGAYCKRRERVNTGGAISRNVTTAQGYKPVANTLSTGYGNEEAHCKRCERVNTTNVKFDKDLDFPPLSKR